MEFSMNSCNPLIKRSKQGERKTRCDLFHSAFYDYHFFQLDEQYLGAFGHFHEFHGAEDFGFIKQIGFG